ncbi:hypothetical protein C1645_814915 [Glomus cerebriforme]|uniref:F-box domain-containing protein n=1 Tax=Glomus cerebriforme TaxID=658196 RepID=A0A397TFP8_9GLOM|nr:hypothetical protein C1645_814915 [Glomus cerebriforme]
MDFSIFDKQGHITLMSSFLPSECLEKIFSYLIEYPSSDVNTNLYIKDLYSCTLVSRHWCRISSPLLYVYPFHHFRENSPQIQPYYKLIRTLLSCIPQSEMKHIKEKLNIKPNSHTISPTFNYVSFIRGIIFHRMMFKSRMICNNKEIWLNEHNPKMISEESTIIIMKYLIKFIYKNCNNLTTLEFPFILKNENYYLIELLSFKRKSKLSNLKELYYSFQIDLFSQNANNTRINFCLSNNVCNLNLLYVNINGINDINQLCRFISSQKKLQHFVYSGKEILYENQYTMSMRNRKDFITEIDNYNAVINSLASQSESLKILEFRDLDLIISIINEEVKKSLSLLKNIKELKLYKCENIEGLHSWVKELKKLEVFEITLHYRRIYHLIYSIESFSSNLTKLIISCNDKTDIDEYYNSLYRQISIYLVSLTHLELPRILPFELIPIFKSCTKLVYLSVILFNVQLMKENLKNLGKHVPKTLKRIQFKESNPDLTISSKLLRFFLEGYANNSGALKYLEIHEVFGDRIYVSELFGVQIIIKSKNSLYIFS